MLGELYRPRGLALEQAQAVLEVREPHAINVALGCVNGCVYCYGPMASRQGKEKWGSVRLPKRRPVELVRKQLANGLDVEGVFLSFLTDPYLPQLREATEHLVNYLDDRDIAVATSSKVGVSNNQWNRNGMTIVSPYPGFTDKYEPGVPSPEKRIRILEEKTPGGFSWVSMEPWPVYEIYPYDLDDILAFWERLSFVDTIIFGKWNYDARARTENARIEYAVTVKLLKAFCKDHDIRLHVKSATLRFIEGGGPKA